MIFKNSDTKKGIVRSLIASSIFFICLKPILEIIWGLFTSISIATYSGFIDQLYLNASLGERNWVSFLIWTVLITALSVFLILSLLLVNTRVEQRRKLRAIKMLGTSDSATEEIKRSRKQVERLERFLHISFKFRHAQIALLIIAALFLLTSTYSDLQLNTSFKRRLNSIAPYIDEQEEELLISRWSRMKSRKDFDSINRDFEEIAKKNKIELPPNLLE